jgi:hypothetical protein
LEWLSMWTPKLQKELGMEDNVCLFMKMQQLISNMHIKQKEEESSSGGTYILINYWNLVKLLCGNGNFLINKLPSKIC